MNVEMLEKRLWEARRVFERVCQRAKACPNGPCRRRKLCLARGGDFGTQGWKAAWFQPTGGCPIMTEAEFASVQAGIRANGSLFEPIFAAQDAEREAEWAALSKDEQERRSAAAPEEARIPRDLFNYGQRLWTTYRPEKGGFCTPLRFQA